MNASSRVSILAVCLLVAGPALVVPRVARAQEADTSTEPTAAAAPASSDRVINMILVKVNGAPIFLSDMEQELENQLALLRAQFSEAELEAQLPELRRNVLTGLIDDRMMMQRADQMGITADANAVDRALQSLREQNNLQSDQDFQAALDSMNLTVEELREQMRKRIRQNQLVFQEVQRSIVVREAEIARYYEENAEQFTAPEQVRLEQMVFVGGTDLRERAAAALEQLRAGADLETVASQFPDASAFPADEGFVPVEDLNESLAAAVPSLQVGVYSDPIQSQFGWHLVRVVERREHSVRPLEEVTDAIRQRLTAQKSQERLSGYLGKLREETHLTILAPEFSDIEEAWKQSDSETAETE